MEAAWFSNLLITPYITFSRGVQKFNFENDVYHISEGNKNLMDVITLSCSGLKNSNLITTPAGHSSPSLSCLPVSSPCRILRCWWITVTLIYYKNDLTHRRACSLRLTWRRFKRKNGWNLYYGDNQSWTQSYIHANSILNRDSARFPKITFDVLNFKLFFLRRKR